MPLHPGVEIGPYTIIERLGAGGMGEVYRARDSKLKREVALKVLPADLANDRERLARFQREAEVLASLNHPHIAHVYGIEGNALVMELVEGEICRDASRADRFRLMTRCRSPSRSPKRSRPRTMRGSFIAT